MLKLKGIKTSVEKVEKSVEGFMSRTENGKNFFNVKANRGAHKKLRLQITAGWSDPPPLSPLYYHVSYLALKANI